MHLKSVTLKNFRSFNDCSVNFRPELTILVGENNSGKSNLIDAIRLLTPPLSGRRDIYCKTTDIRFDSGQRFDLSALYEGLSDKQQGAFLTAPSNKDLNDAVFGLSYDESSGGFPTRPTTWASGEQRPSDDGSHGLIRHVYLPALRDAKYALASGNPTRVLALLKQVLSDDEQDELRSQAVRGATLKSLKTINKSVDSGLGELTGGVRQQIATLGFATTETLNDLARDLRFSLADQGIRPEDLSLSGHGYANLLYMATIAVELEKVSSADLTLFLVEEPEAHLHPQLQAAVLAFLKKRAKKSRDAANTKLPHAGELQVIVATHSPNLSSSVASKNLVFVRSVFPKCAHEDQRNITMEAEKTVSVGKDEIVVRRESKAIALANLLKNSKGEDDKKARRKIDRYIDVTKASFLFGGRTLLVEGIAEALLIPVLAERFILKNDEGALRKFRSTSIVPIDGVDFKPYVRLLTTKQNDVCIADRLVVLTDGDGPKKEEAKCSDGENRKTALDAIAAENDASDIYETKINEYSLESEIFLAGNAQIMRSAYLALHPLSESKWDSVASKTGDDLAIAMHELFKEVRKGDYAQELAAQIEDSVKFVVPQYLAETIKAVVELDHRDV